MLQSTGDSVDLKNLISRLEKRAREIQPFIEGVLERARRLVVAYHRLGYLPAQVIYWMTSTLDDWSKVLIGDAGTLAYYTLVYNEPGETVFFTTNPASVSTIQFLQAADLTGYKILVLSSEPGNDVVRDNLAKYNPVYIDASDELEASLIMGIAAYKATAKHYRDKMGRRGERLYLHAKEGFAVVVDELYAKYSGILNEIKDVGEIRVTAPRIIEASANYIVEALRGKGVNAWYEPIEYVTGPGHVLLLATGVDEYLLREKRFRLGMTGARLHVLEMNTDPLEAQIYLAILGYLYSRVTG